MKAVNFILLQWLFFRLTRCEHTIIDEFNLTEISIMPGNEHAIGGDIKKHHTEYWYSLQWPIMPLTGWWSPFISTGKRFFIKISKTYTK